MVSRNLIIIGHASAWTKYWSRTVPTYRLHFIVNGQLLAGEAFDADSDRLAKAYVESRRAGRAAKLWSLDRLVRTYAQ